VAKRHPDLLFDPDTDPDPDFIRFAQMTAERIINLYDLADAAYDAKEIREMSARLGHVAIIDHNARYNERTAVDRVEALAKPPSSVLQAQYSEASIQNSELETAHAQLF
jgi:hypothetical protein